MTPKQPLAKGWDSILDVLCTADMTYGIYLPGGALLRIDDLPWRQPLAKALAKGGPPIHTTTAKNRPLRRASTAPKGTT